MRKVTWELEDKKCTKYFFQELEKRKMHIRVYFLLKVNKTANYLKINGKY